MSDGERLSLNAYAKRRGVRLYAVQLAVKEGRIPVGNDGLIDPKEADSAWDANTNPAQQRKSGSAPPNFQVARAKNEELKVRERELALAEREGRLIDREKAIGRVHALARAGRDALLTWPASRAAEIASEIGPNPSPHHVQAILDRHVRELAEQIGGLKLDI